MVVAPVAAAASAEPLPLFGAVEGRVVLVVAVVLEAPAVVGVGGGAALDSDSDDDDEVRSRVDGAGTPLVEP